MKYNVIIGGPGGSGSSAVAKAVSERLNLPRFYGGGMMREFAQKEGFENVNTFLEGKSEEEVIKYDKDVDQMLIAKLKEGDTLVESKIVATILPFDMPKTVKIWLDCDIDTRTKRTLESKSDLYQNFDKAKEDLIRRYELDANRYLSLYNVDYKSPQKYYDLVLDSSKQTLDQTVQTVLDFIKKELSPVDVLNDPLLTDKEHDDDLYLSWSRKKCLICGLVIEKPMKILSCPRCKNSSPDKFEDLD